MLQYVAKRLVGMVPTLMILLFLAVVMVDLVPGNIIDIMLQEQRSVDEESRRALEAELGLDRPLPVRYVQYAAGVFVGDLGESLWSNSSVRDEIASRALVTIEIGIVATIIGSIVGVLFGVMSALRQDSFTDYLLRSVAIAGISVPNFAIATAIVVLPAIWWGISPNLRYVGFTEAPWPHLKIIILPALVLSTNLAASLMRLTRTTMLEVLRQDYMRTAAAKGLGERQIVIRHGLKNAIIPVVTLMGLQIAVLIGGSVITESVFVIPGIGRLLLVSIGNRDYPVIQGIVVVIGLFTMVVNLVIDLSYAWIDPRIRYA